MAASDVPESQGRRVHGIRLDASERRGNIEKSQMRDDEFQTNGFGYGSDYSSPSGFISADGYGELLLDHSSCGGDKGIFYFLSDHMNGCSSIDSKGAGYGPGNGKGSRYGIGYGDAGFPYGYENETGECDEGNKNAWI